MPAQVLWLALAFCAACSKQTAPGDHAVIRYLLPGAVEDSYIETSNAGWNPVTGAAFFQTDNASFERMHFSLAEINDTGIYTLTAVQQMSWSQSDKFVPQTTQGSVHIIARTGGLCKAEFSIQLRDSLSSTPLRSITGEFSIVHQP